MLLIYIKIISNNYKKILLIVKKPFQFICIMFTLNNILYKKFNNNINYENNMLIILYYLMLLVMVYNL
jgi:hypothetical protein